MEQANAKNVGEYFGKLKKIGRIALEEVFLVGKGVELFFEKKFTASQEKTLRNDVTKILDENFSGSYELGKLNYDVGESILTIEIEDSGAPPKIPTAMHEAGSAFVLDRVLRNNKKFTSPADILDDVDTKKGLDEIFKGNYNDGLKEWVYTFFEHQEAFFKKFQPPQWDVFEHGGQDLMTFIKEQCAAVKEVTASGKLNDVGMYETWNPSDIWVVKNKGLVKDEIEKAIQKDGTATLKELNNVLLKLIKENRLIGLSLKQIKSKENATFVYVNKDPKKIEFAQVEEIKMSDIKFEIKTKKDKNVGDMNQGGYCLFGKYTINIIRTPTSGFSNLKFESVVKGSGGRGGAAPVAMVGKLLKSRNPSATFVNDNNKYPKTKDEFLNDRRDYEKMYKSLNGIITGTKNYAEFKSRIISMYESKNSKSRGVAQSKLMQLHFFSDALAKKKNEPELWTDMLYLSLKVGKRFAPHGKLA